MYSYGSSALDRTYKVQPSTSCKGYWMREDSSAHGWCALASARPDIQEQSSTRIAEPSSRDGLPPGAHARNWSGSVRRTPAFPGPRHPVLMAVATHRGPVNFRKRRRDLPCRKLTLGHRDTFAEFYSPRQKERVKRLGVNGWCPGKEKDPPATRA